jgi:hypothetical protein
MSSAQLYRLSGLGLLAGAVLSIVSSLIMGIAFSDSSNPAVATNPLNIGLGIVGVIGSILALVGLPGLYLVRAAEGGVVWLIGVLLIAVTGMLFGIFLGLTFTLIFPALAERAPALLSQGPPPSFLSVFIIGTLANVVGAALMGAPMLTRHIFPAWCGWLMILEAVLAAVGFFVNGPSSGGIVSQIIGTIAPLPLFIVIGWIGYELETEKVAPAGGLHRVANPQPA